MYKKASELTPEQLEHRRAAQNARHKNRDPSKLKKNYLNFRANHHEEILAKEKAEREALTGEKVDEVSREVVNGETQITYSNGITRKPTGETISLDPAKASVMSHSRYVKGRAAAEQGLMDAINEHHEKVGLPKITKGEQIMYALGKEVGRQALEARYDRDRLQAVSKAVEIADLQPKNAPAEAMTPLPFTRYNLQFADRLTLIAEFSRETSPLPDGEVIEVKTLPMPDNERHPKRNWLGHGDG